MTDDRLEWFPCYPSKLLGALSRMKPMEGYTYWVVCLRIYETNGPCRDSLDNLCRLIGLNKRRVSEALDSLFRAGKLKRTADGIINPFAAEVLASVNQKRESRSTAGKEGADRRWKKTQQNQRKGDSIPNAEPLAKNAELELEVVSESAKADSTPVKPKVESDWPNDYQDQFWKAYPRHEGKKAALAKLDVVRKSNKVPWATLIGGVQRYAKQKAGTEEKYIKQPTTWINQGCWDDEFKNGGDYGKARGPDEKLGFAGLAARVRFARAARDQEAAFFDDASDAGSSDGCDDPPQRMERVAGGR